jgi:PPM family protein phosphatase
VPALQLTCTARSDVGRRPNNEDSLFASARLAAVADGVGGAAGGEVASRVVVNALALLDKCWPEGPLEEAFPAAILSGNETVAFVAACRPELSGMASTVTAVALADDGRYLVANVGDSRTYLLRGGRLERLTRDATLVQALVDRGAITEGEARAHPQRSVVIDALDGRPRREVVLSARSARIGDRLLLCSDGLSDVVSDATIAAALSSPDRAAAADRLIELALEAGARDNVSVLVADVTPRADAVAGWARPSRPGAT